MVLRSVIWVETWPSLIEKLGVFETYDRTRSGPRVDEKEWDRRITFQTANKLKEKYKLEFDHSKIIPTDTDMIDRLYQAGLEMLVEMDVFCPEPVNAFEDSLSTNQ
jgi:methylamine--corrinoid protein Co-methyltransferase